MPKLVTTVHNQHITTFLLGIHCFLYATLILGLQPKHKTLLDKRQTNTSSNQNIKNCFQHLTILTTNYTRSVDHKKKKEKVIQRPSILLVFIYYPSNLLVETLLFLIYCSFLQYPQQYLHHFFHQPHQPHQLHYFQATK